MSTATATSTLIGRCLKCTVEREMTACRRITLKNGRPATEGECSVCGTRMFTLDASD